MTLDPPSAYRAPCWLRNPHWHTVYASSFVPCPRVAWRRERLETPDGDFIDLDWIAQPVLGMSAADAGAPLVVLFHGLEGGSSSHYARSLMDHVRRLGWHGAVVHFRGCSGEPNRLARAYHSGDSAEIDWVLGRLRARPFGPLVAVGVSLGGNALLKWLGEMGAAAQARLQAACAICAPIDLTAAGEALERGFSRLYAWNFLRTMKRKSLYKLRRHPELFEPRRLRDARTLRAFDDCVTAPLHGFIDADDYWRRCSSKPLLPHIRVPTLVLNARDDPFLPADRLPRANEVSSSVELDLPAQGGHCAFVTGAFPGRLTWMPRRVIAFIAHALGARELRCSGVG